MLTQNSRFLVYLFLKFIHLVLAISLVGMTLFNAVYTLGLSRGKNTRSKDSIRFGRHIDVTLFSLIGATFILVSLMVYPSGFTFHTTWIKAAYLLLLIITVCLCISIPLKKSLFQTPSTIKRGGLYLLFAIMLICFYMIIHDAITKQTLLRFLQ